MRSMHRKHCSFRAADCHRRLIPQFNRNYPPLVGTKHVSPKLEPEGKVNPDTNGLDESLSEKKKRD